MIEGVNLAPSIFSGVIMLVLAIDTSCDETAAAVVQDGRRILSNIVASQVAVHADYGGVVPEIASRKHIETISVVIQSAISEAGAGYGDLQGVAVTQGPGLAGALLVGLATAKAIAFARNIPVVGVNHIEGHLAAPFLEQELEFPYLALVVSGGHTHLYRVDGIGRYQAIGQTLDDAAGEAFDKVAKILGLHYPGGVVVDRLAGEGDSGAVKLPRPLIHDGTCNFSFSGLKTAVLTAVERQPLLRDDPLQLKGICASFQAAVCDVLITKTALALQRTGLKRLVVSGGVACNSSLRLGMGRLAESAGVKLHIPSPQLCSDNAAMIAVPGDFYLSNGSVADLSLDALPTWPLDRIGGNI
jgi:N6-L-threonylcarbamoyladenine synthase